MARIDETALARALAPAIVSGPSALDGEAFQSALSNSEESGSVRHGIRICYGETEGVTSIRRAYEHLTEPISPEEFAAQIARALQIFARPFREGCDNSTYPHFLLHGIELPRVGDVIGKILDNARILHESEEARERLTKTVQSPVPVLGERCQLWLMNGYADDSHGLSLKLVERERGTLSTRMAKSGFVFDVTNKTAFIINVQGRPRQRGEGNEIRRADARLGRRYASVSNALGKDPRIFVVEEAVKLFRRWGFETVRAIKPEHHVMNIAGHHEFSSGYEPVLLSAGITEDNGIYRSAALVAGTQRQHPPRDEY